jgi:multiple sugar transport system ATP-binding protein
MADVSLAHLTRSFAATPPAGLFDVSLQIADGEIMAVVGPSGAGKTTLLRLIAGLESPDSGVISIAGKDVTSLPPRGRDIGLLPQHSALYPHLSIRRNLSIGLEMSRVRVSALETERRIEHAIKLLELGDIMNRRPNELSGGERQRVALGRLMVRRPAVWLLDEPIVHVDSARKTEFRQQLHLLRDQLPTTIIIVTHDPVEAQTLGQRLAVLQGGRLRQVDTPAEAYARPVERFVAEFLAWPGLNLANGILVRSAEPDKGLLFAAADGSFRLPVPAELATHGAEGQPVTLGIRPEDVHAGAASPSIRDGSVHLQGWRVRVGEFVAPRWLTTAEKGAMRWFVWSEASPTRGESLDLTIGTKCIHWFDGKTGLRL